MRTGEKAVRTAAKRRTRVRRLCECTILQGDEAQRNNPVIRPSYKKNAQRAFFYNRTRDVISRNIFILSLNRLLYS